MAAILLKTRPDTRLLQSRAGGQGPYLRSLDHLGRSSEAKNRKNPKKVKCDGRTDGPTDGRTDGRTDGPTKRVVESRSTRLKRGKQLETRIREALLGRDGKNRSFCIVIKGYKYRSSRRGMSCYLRFCLIIQNHTENALCLCVFECVRVCVCICV